MTGIPKNREPSAAAAVFVLEGEDKVNLADAVAEEQLGVGLGVPKLAILEGRKGEMTALLQVLRVMSSIALYEYVEGRYV